MYCVMAHVQGKKRKASSQGQARMYVAKDESAAAAFNQGRSMQELQEVPLGQRATSTSGRDSVVTARCAFSSPCTFPLSCTPLLQRLENIRKAVVHSDMPFSVHHCHMYLMCTAAVRIVLS